ncbi:ABC transporter permease [Gilvimarinus sp. F26214L]|uniref:ABC transporter permease n=1 Tax=Gilvimarinus sp. DZF01 TaxID=3461371 RepID=UPI0040460BDB
MKRYVLSRFAEMVVALFLMSVVVFLLGRLTGDPVALLLSDYASDEDRARITRELGLDQPLITQYGNFAARALRGDLGSSLMGEQRPALEMVLERFPASVKLAAVAFVFSMAVGIPLGVVAAVRQGEAGDIGARLLALLGQSIPAFWLGLVLMYLFGVKLGWLPTSGYGSWTHYVLPAITMGLFTTAAVTRLVRSSMMDALSSEYVRLARVKGLSEAGVVWKHALRNSLIPVMTFMGTFFATMITGAVVVETVFSWPGIGRLAFEAILNRDFPLIQAVVLFMTALFIVINLIVDLAYAWVDPRIRHGSR